MKDCEETRGKILDYLKETGIISIACNKAGISRNTFYRWIKDDYEFSKEAELALEEGNYHIDDLAKNKHIELIKNGHWPAIKYRLDHAKSFGAQKMNIFLK